MIDYMNNDKISGYNDLRLSVSGNEYDHVLGFFNKRMKSEDIAETFTMIMFTVAREIEVNVIDLVQSLKNKDEIEITSTIALLVNGLRDSSVLLGINQISAPKFYAARTVLQ